MTTNIIKSEVYSINKVAYWFLYNLTLWGFVLGDFKIAAIIATVWILINFWLDNFIFHPLGKMLGITSFRFLTFATKTRNGKILSFLFHSALWMQLAGLIACDYYAINSVQMMTISTALGLLVFLQFSFVSYMVIRKLTPIVISLVRKLISKVRKLVLRVLAVFNAS